MIQHQAGRLIINLTGGFTLKEFLVVFAHVFSAISGSSVNCEASGPQIQRNFKARILSYSAFF